MSLSIHTFAIEDDDIEGRFGIQWQFPTFDLNCTSTDLSFTQRVLDLVDETRANPDFRDIPLGSGRYRYMEPKGIDISDCFEDLCVSLFKCGECDHGYNFRFESSGDFYVGFHLAGEQIDDFLYGLKEIVEDNLVDQFKSEAP